MLSVYREHGVVPKDSRRDNFNKTPEDLRRYLQVRSGDLVVNKMKAWSGSVGVSGHEGIVSGDYLVCAISPMLDARFLHHVMRSTYFIGAMRTRSKGIRPSQERLYWEDLAEIAVPVPGLAEQRRIADFLDDQVTRIDRVADGHRSHRGLVKRRLATALEALMTGKHATEMVPAAWLPFGRVPTTWREAQLRSVRCEVQTGPFGSQLHSDEYVEDGWPVVNPANLKANGIVSLPEMMVDDATRGRLTRHVLAPGDVVFGRRGELGRAGLVDERQRGWVCGTGSLRVRLTGDELDPQFLLRLLRTSAIRYYFETQAVGSTMANLNTGILMGMPILLPSPTEQRTLVREAVAIERSHGELDVALQRQIQLLQERKRTLITAAVTGEFDASSASTRASAAVVG